MRISLLLILVTVGLPGCASGTGTSRPASASYPAATPRASADPVPSEPGPRSWAPAGRGAAAPSAAGHWFRREHQLPPWRRLPVQGTPETPGPIAEPDGGNALPEAAVPEESPAGSTRPGVRPKQRAGSPPSLDDPPPGYHTSLVYSGLLGLVISAVGLVMVGYRRRSW